MNCPIAGYLNVGPSLLRLASHIHLNNPTMTTPYSTTSLTACSLLLLLLWGSVAQQHAVLDVNGDELVVGRDYIISSTYPGPAGGFLSLRPGTCPQPVIQTSSDRQPGLPASFWPASGARGGPVNVSANLDIQFIVDAATWAQCDVNPVLMMVNSLWTGIGAVRTGGEIGSNNDPANWFRIEPYESNYKLLHCRACEICELSPSCRDLSIRQDLQGRRLVPALSGERPFEVVFRKGCWGN